MKYTVGMQDSIVKSNIPVGSGNMLQNGTITIDTGLFIHTHYDTVRVPYIPAVEESGEYQGFISQGTVGQINSTISFGDINAPRLSSDDLVSLGVVQRINSSMR